MRDDRTDITIVLDRSGSMKGHEIDTNGGFDSFIADQRQVPGECSVTLVQFDDQYEVAYTAKPVGEVPPCHLEPRGMTALYDAIGKTIVTTGQRLAAIPESERPAKVIFLVFTDGYENHSREYTAERVKEMVELQQGTYNWQFIFVGANQDAILSAGTIGIAGDAALSNTNSAKGIRNAYAAVSSNVADYRQGAVTTMAFSPEQRTSSVDA